MSYRLIKQIDFYHPKTNNYASTTSYSLGKYSELYKAQEDRREAMIKNRHWDLRDDRAVKYIILDSTSWPITE